LSIRQATITSIIGFSLWLDYVSGRMETRQVVDLEMGDLSMLLADLNMMIRVNLIKIKRGY